MSRMRAGELELCVETVGSGEPLLCLMGLGGDRHGWSLIRDDLARRHRLILLDNRDAGESDQARSAYGLADMAADALAVLDRLGIERVHVLGASMGGTIAQHLALAAPHRVASLVLASTWGRTDGFLRALFGSWRELAERLEPDVFHRVLLSWAFTYRAHDGPSAELSALHASVRERGVWKSVAAYQRQIDACLGHDVLGFLPLLRTPTCVLVGEDDIVTPPRYARGLAASIVGAEVTLLPATGHACFLETPRVFADRVLRFLAHRRVAA